MIFLERVLVRMCVAHTMPALEVHTQVQHGPPAMSLKNYQEETWLGLLITVWYIACGACDASPPLAVQVRGLLCPVSSKVRIGLIALD